MTNMKKIFSALCAAVMTFMFSVTAFAGAPVLFEETAGIINTGGEGLGLMIGAGVLAVLAIGGMIFFFFQMHYFFYLAINFIYLQIIRNYFINIASPKLKKRYFSSTAVLYAFIILSLPARLETNIINVDFGRWKLVIKASTAFHL